MHHIVYTSRATRSLSEDDLQKLCQQSTDYNCKVGVTGLLVYDGVRYMQLIEGEGNVVHRLMSRITTDTRHDKIIYMSNIHVSERQFEMWGLACIGFNLNTTGSEFIQNVKNLVVNVKDMYVKANFIGFAALSK